jgi:hypothetical protein
LTLKTFDRLVESANDAYEILKELGPFNGREHMKDPTFRTTAEPVILPSGSKQLLETLGNDLLAFGRALKLLSPEHQETLGLGLDFQVPPTWRIDAIVTTEGDIRINEIEGVDGANALMMAEQFAYHLQPLEESTAAKLIPALKAMCRTPQDGVYKIALIKVNVAGDALIPNAKRFINFLQTLSRGTVQVDLLDGQEVLDGTAKPDWALYHGVMNESFVSPDQLHHLGVQKRQLIASGNYNALGNKGAFALLFDPELERFWEEKLGNERFIRLKKRLIPSVFIYTESDIYDAQKEEKVVKVSWAGTNTTLINRSRGVAIPKEGLEQGSNERWETLRDFFRQGLRVIAQDYIEPAKIKAFLRKKGTTLEAVEWYNRVCVKYVALGDPNATEMPDVALTAIEVTLGPDIIPAGRACSFTAGVLS